jgi:hypothetical protein
VLGLASWVLGPSWLGYPLTRSYIPVRACSTVSKNLLVDLTKNLSQNLLNVYVLRHVGEICETTNSSRNLGCILREKSTRDGEKVRTEKEQKAKVRMKSCFPPPSMINKMYSDK